MTPDLLTRDEAADLLAPHLAEIENCIQQAWARWLANPDCATASKSHRAAVVYDYMTQEISKAFSSKPGILLKWKHNSLNMVVGDSAIIRFKKFRGRTFKTSGIATGARNAFLSQGGVHEGMVVTNLIVGYLLDQLEVEPVGTRAQ